MAEWDSKTADSLQGTAVMPVIMGYMSAGSELLEGSCQCKAVPLWQEYSSERVITHTSDHFNMSARPA